MNFSELDSLTDSLSDVEIAVLHSVTRVTVIKWRNKLKVKSFTQKTGLIKSPDGSSLSRKESGIALGSNHLQNLGRPFKDTEELRFFESLDSEIKAYALGLIAADGYIQQGRTVCISLHTDDSEHLRLLGELIGVKHNVRLDPDNSPRTSKRAFLEINSKRMVNDLASWGITPNKSKTLTILREIEKPLLGHFLRGVWDGDGWIGERQFALASSSHSFVEQVHSWVLSSTGFNLTIREQKQGQYQLGGSKKSGDVLRWMYRNSNVSLERKAIQFSRFWV